MYNSVGAGTGLAITGLALAQYFLAGWVLLMVGVAIIAILPKRKKDQED